MSEWKKKEEEEEEEEEEEVKVERASRGLAEEEVKVERARKGRSLAGATKFSGFQKTVTANSSSSLPSEVKQEKTKDNNKPITKSRGLYDEASEMIGKEKAYEGYSYANDDSIDDDDNKKDIKFARLVDRIQEGIHDIGSEAKDFLKRSLKS